MTVHRASCTIGQDGMPAGGCPRCSQLRLDDLPDDIQTAILGCSPASLFQAILDAAPETGRRLYWVLMQTRALQLMGEH